MRLDALAGPAVAAPQRTTVQPFAPVPAFARPAGAPQPAPRALPAVSPLVAGLDMVLALQAAGSERERRRRALRHAEALLDELEALRLDLLASGATGERLRRLTALADRPRERSDDAGLDDLLREIDVRVAVEMAKLEPATAAAA